jgi:hypothetical protein
LQTAAQLQAKTLPGLKMFVAGLVAEGLTVLAGAPKLGKSLLALDLALCVADGTQFLGARTRQCGVIYLALEDSERRLQDRIRLILGAAPQWPQRFRYLTKLPSPLMRQHLVGMCDSLIDQHPDVELLVFDTLARVKPPQRAGANQYDADTDAWGPLQAWAVARRVAVLGLHHDRKAGAPDWLDSLSGSKGLSGVADTALLLRGERGGPRANLFVTSRDLDDREAWKLERGGGPVWRLAGRAPAGAVLAQTGLGDAQAQLAGFLAANPAGVRPVDVAAALPALFPSAQRASQALWRLADQGRASKLGRGLYGPTS